MNKLGFLLSFLVLFIVSSLLLPTRTFAQQISTIGADLSTYVQPSGSDCNINVPLQYSTIQAAIDAASVGDTICVGSGTFNEGITINKSVRISGAGAANSIINGPVNAPAIYAIANNFTLEGFRIIGGGNDIFHTTVVFPQYLSGAKMQYNYIVSGNTGYLLFITGYRSDDIIQNNIFVGNNSGELMFVSHDGSPINEQILNNTFTGTVAVNARQDTGVIMIFGGTNSVIKGNIFNATGVGYTIMGIAYTPNTITENNFDSTASFKLYISGGATPYLYAENNWWGTPDDPANIIAGAGIVDYSNWATSPFLEYPVPSFRQITSLGPARVWIGLKNSDDVGVKFDLLAEVYKNGTELVSSAELDHVSGGSSGFNRAILQSIPFSLSSPVSFPDGSTLSIKVYVRNTCFGGTHNSGVARLWYNDSAANSFFGVQIDSVASNYYLLDNFLLSTLVGSGPKKYIDVQSGSPCSAWKSFGTWSL